MAQEKITEAQLGESLTVLEQYVKQEKVAEAQSRESLAVFEQCVKHSDFTFRVSVSKDSQRS